MQASKLMCIIYLYIIIYIYIYVYTHIYIYVYMYMPEMDVSNVDFSFWSRVQRVMIKIKAHPNDHKKMIGHRGRGP